MLQEVGVMDGSGLSAWWVLEPPRRHVSGLSVWVPPNRLTEKEDILGMWVSCLVFT